MSQAYVASNKILDYNFGATSYVVPGTYYVGLSTTVIGNDGSGATEPSGGAYARVSFVNNKTNFGTAALGSLSNATAITFAESSLAWGTITYVFISDSLTGGNIYYFEALPTPKVVSVNTTLVFSIGAMVISMTN